MVTTHVLDAAPGRPAEGMRVRLERADGTVVATAVTDADGRVRDLGRRRSRAPTGWCSRPGRGSPPRLARRSTRRSSSRSPWTAAAPPRAAAALAVRLLDLPGELTPMAIVLGDNRYGKAETRLVRSCATPSGTRSATSPCRRRCAATSPPRTSTATRRNVLPTDTQKNTVYAFAKERGVGATEEFARELARHFVDDVAPVTSAQVVVEEHALGARHRRRAAARPHVRAQRGRDPHGGRDGVRRRASTCCPG